MSESGKLILKTSPRAITSSAWCKEVRNNADIAITRNDLLPLAGSDFPIYLTTRHQLANRRGVWVCVCFCRRLLQIFRFWCRFFSESDRAVSRSHLSVIIFACSVCSLAGVSLGNPPIFSRRAC